MLVYVKQTNGQHSITLTTALLNDRLVATIKMMNRTTAQLRLPDYYVLESVK